MPATPAITTTRPQAARERVDDLLVGPTNHGGHRAEGAFRRPLPRSKVAIDRPQASAPAKAINKTYFLLYQCVHGLGHGADDLQPQRPCPTRSRSATTWRQHGTQTSCTGVVFMQNFLPGADADRTDEVGEQTWEPALSVRTRLRWRDQALLLPDGHVADPAGRSTTTSARRAAWWGRRAESRWGWRRASSPSAATPSGVQRPRTRSRSSRLCRLAGSMETPVASTAAPADLTAKRRGARPGRSECACSPPAATGARIASTGSERSSACSPTEQPCGGCENAAPGYRRPYRRDCYLGCAGLSLRDPGLEGLSVTASRTRPPARSGFRTSVEEPAHDQALGLRRVRFPRRHSRRKSSSRLDRADRPRRGCRGGRRFASISSPGGFDGPRAPARRRIRLRFLLVGVRSSARPFSTLIHPTPDRGRVVAERGLLKAKSKEVRVRGDVAPGRCRSRGAARRRRSRRRVKRGGVAAPRPGRGFVLDPRLALLGAEGRRRPQSSSASRFDPARGARRSASSSADQVLQRDVLDLRPPGRRRELGKRPRSS